MRRFESIDILRGFAALSVVVYHVINHFQWTEFPHTGPLWWFRIGWLGVDLFFVISGFVISLTAFAGIDRVGAIGFRSPFARHRFWRIAPLYYLTSVLFVVFVMPELLFQGDFAWQAVTHLFYVHNMHPLTSGTINGPNWSVATEMQFYLFVLLIAPWLRTAKPWLIGALFLLIAWSWRAAVFFLVPIDPDLGVHTRFVYSAQLPGSLDLFVVGILLARLVRSEPGQRFLVTFGRYSPVAFMLAAMALVAVALRLYSLYPEYWPSFTMVTFFRSVIALAAGGVVLAACCMQHPLWLVTTAPLRYLGTISYGIYLWHLPVIESLQRVPGLSGPVALPLVIALTLLLASASWHFFEKPFISRNGSLEWATPHITTIGHALAGAMLLYFAISIATSKFVSLP